MTLALMMKTKGQATGLGQHQHQHQHHYHRRSTLLADRLKQIQRDNETLLHRVYKVKKLTKRYKKEIKFLMNRLDMHGDPFRNIKEEEDVKPDLDSLNAEIQRRKDRSSNSNRSNNANSSRKNPPPKKKPAKPENKKKPPNRQRNIAMRSFNFAKGKINSWS